MSEVWISPSCHCAVPSRLALSSGLSPCDDKIIATFAVVRSTFVVVEDEPEDGLFLPFVSSLQALLPEMLDTPFPKRPPPVEVNPWGGEGLYGAKPLDS